MKRLRLAVVGTGHLGGIHARLAAANPHYELAAIVDPLANPRDALAAELKVPAHSDHRALIGRIDAAVIATPTRFHHAVAHDLIRAGVHLLIEKPITTTVTEADELVALAQHHHCVLQVGHVERFNPVLAAAADHIQSPKYIEARRYCGHSFRSTDISVVLDLMIHDLDLVLSMTSGPPMEVSALGATVLGPHTDVATARLVFADGCVANLSASRVSYQACREMQIWSARGFVGLDFATRTAKVVSPAEAVRQGEVKIEGLAPDARKQMQERLFTELLPLTTITVPERNALADEQTDFAESILTARAPRVTGLAGRDALAAAEAVVNSIVGHVWDGSNVGHISPSSDHRPAVLPGPHWGQSSGVPTPHRQAG
ncbi:MAG: Gfo/Idh/MocA family oxidoreductase [Planctomycetes bacterium]|nr:Gfo/Idh/MocA family oxidoreductase [Planctomycetota bacterium]